MRITPPAPVSTSEYANRNHVMRNVCYYVERHGNAWVPIVYGKLREPELTPWIAMREAKKLADKIAGALRDRGIRARAVQLRSTPTEG